MSAGPLFLLAGTTDICRHGKAVIQWRGFDVRRSFSPEGFGSADLAFCRNGRPVRRFHQDDVSAWKLAGPHPKMDLDGDGKPELATAFRTGDAHCRTSMMVFRRVGARIDATRLERHIKLYCYYDAHCDVDARARQIEGGNPAC